MKKLQKSKKGFTLTELAIVIAVIAILIAVLVPTFISLINKANESSDSQLVKNLNTALTVDEASNGSAETMSEALEVAADYGYNVDKLTPSSSGDIVWDQASNRFLLIGSEGIVYKDGSTSESVTSTTYQLWYIAQKESDIEEDKYSYYIAYTTTAVSATYGVDVGNNTGVAVSISGRKEASIIVNTNGGSLTIDAENYDVYHYGTASTVTITKVAATSYHLYGEVASKIEIAQGRVVCEAGSFVLSIIVTGTISSNNIAIVVDSSAEVGGIGTNNSDNLNSLANIVTGDGSSSTSVNTTTATYNTAFAGGTGESGSPYLIETAEQFVNIGSLSEEMISTAYYFKLSNDINLDDASSKITNGYITEYFHGELDGDSKTIYALSSASIYFIGNSTLYDATIKDVNVYQQEGYALTLVYVANWYRAQVGEVLFSGITILGDKITDVGTNFSSFVNFVADTVTFKNCTNSVDIAGTSGVYFGIFIGGYALYGSGTTTAGVAYTRENNITFDTCVNTATVTGSHIGFLSGNANQGIFYTVSNADFSDRTTSDGYDSKYSAAYVTNCYNTGTIFATRYCGAFAPTNGSSTNGETNGNATAHQALNDKLTDTQFKNKNRMQVSSVTMSVALNDSKGLDITCNEEGTLSITYYVSVSYPGVGSNYVWVTLEVTNKVAKYVTKIIDGTKEGYTYNGTSYSELKNANDNNSTDSSEDSYGHSYKLVANSDGSYVIIVGEINKMSGATSYSIGSSLTYIVSLTQNDAETGTLVGYVEDL